MGVPVPKLSGERGQGGSILVWQAGNGWGKEHGFLRHCCYGQEKKKAWRNSTALSPLLLLLPLLSSAADGTLLLLPVDGHTAHGKAMSVCHGLLAPTLMPSLACVLLLHADGVPCFKGVPFQTSQGVITSSLPNAWVK